VSRTDSPLYTIGFAAAICVVCAALVSVSAVSLRDRQDINRQVYRQKNVLLAAGILKPGDSPSDRQVLESFEKNIRVRLVDLATGLEATGPGLDPRTYDQNHAKNDPDLSRKAPPNLAQVIRVPKVGAVYIVDRDGRPDQLVIPVEGAGMWGLVAGFLALDRDTRTVRGVTFYEQKETPGLGGEVANPRWQALWAGRKAYDEKWEPSLTVIKGRAGPAEADHYHVDGLSGATITSRGVSRLMAFWLSKDGYGAFLTAFREGGGK